MRMFAIGQRTKIVDSDGKQRSGTVISIEDGVLKIETDNGERHTAYTTSKAKQEAADEAHRQKWHHL